MQANPIYDDPIHPDAGSSPVSLLCGAVVVSFNWTRGVLSRL